MAWGVEFAPAATRELDKLDPPVIRRVLKFISERLASLEDPRRIGQALRGAHLGEFWKYRVGPYRLIAKIEDGRRMVLILRIGHRREIYRSIP